MRPEILFSSFAPVTSLTGIGPRLAKLVAKAAGPRIVDLYWHLPTGIIDRRFTPKVAAAPEGQIATLTVKVERHYPSPRHLKRVPYKIRCSDETGVLTLIFFHGRPDHLEKLLPPGEVRLVSGKVERYVGETQITHPDYIGALEESASLIAVEPIYPLTTGLAPKVMRKAVAKAIDCAPGLNEWIDAAYLVQQRWEKWRDALTAAHRPQALGDLGPETPARQRLAFDELLANQLALALVRQSARRSPGRAIAGDGRLRNRILAALPYRLTAAQLAALNEICADMATPEPMIRLLQGDVGSGKTIVAFAAMLNAVECGGQAALMVPTDLLARQHFKNLAPLSAAAGARTALLTGRDGKKARDETFAALAAGTIDIVIGTHALFQDEVAFKDLAFVVIDEQHRFGVDQRLALSTKALSGDGGGLRPDLLLMTATPIPRTLTLTTYGDIDVSRITEMPPGRTPVETRAVPIGRVDEVIAAVGRAIAKGARAYWVCPLVDEADLDLAAAAERHKTLSALFPGRVGLVHGQMKADLRESAMAAFMAGETQIVVATTVIEVGVDVPEATIIVIEHAERFGLAQLHQLRGRVGRGTEAGSCVLLYATPLTETARARIDIMRQTRDGFRIAEEDLRLRGSGELLGTRQSGLPEFKLANLEVHGELLQAARDDARLILERDPTLSSERGGALRVLLYLFERDAAIRNLRSG
ncbi:MAG: ATP-dependent DNA helicase RecG [Alphaproteobacteria bacterium]|nr:ATP-dependent DNA helicase RecG [Alphaproteobacteria bacterium]